MAIFVLVHGGFHGGWCWRKLLPHLAVAGHTAFTPTLTGLGERAHLLAPSIRLETHMQDVLGVLAFEDLWDVVLVGHSMAGTVITGVADRAANRLGHLVYLDASVPRDGECDLDCVRPGERVWLEARAAVDGWAIAPLVSMPPFGITDEADAAWVADNLRPHPLAAFTDPVRVADPHAFAGARTYIWCTGGTTDDPPPPVARVRVESGWAYHEMATGHDAMVTAPGALADLLLGIVAR
jgi:pimeloyl-ACP methyl ester carboxylesterase